MTSRRPGRIWGFVGAVLLGAAAAFASARAGHYGQAVFGFVVIAGLGAFLAFSTTEWAVAQTVAADERQQSLNGRAMITAYHAVVAVTVVGFLRELAHGETGPFTLVGAVAGFTHMLSLAILRRRG